MINMRFEISTMNEQHISAMLPTHMLSGETSLEGESLEQRNSAPASPITQFSDQVSSDQVVGAAAGTEVGEPSTQGQDSDEDDDAASERTGNDSAISGIGSYATSTYTVDSAVIEKVVENGRTYHSYKDGKYALPNDEPELNRLDIQHKMWLITLDEKLHLAPIGPNPQNVLDMATGTGIWAIDFGIRCVPFSKCARYRSIFDPARVFRVPPNCQFEIDDVEDEWLFPFKFDYIHGRSLATCFKDPQSVIAKAYDALLPGGWFELQDVCLQSSEDGSHYGTSLEEVQKYLSEATTETGRRWDNVPNYKRWMIEQGFEDVYEFNYRWPTNSQWPRKRKEKILGAWFQAQVESGMLEAAVTRLFMMKLGWSREQLVTFLSVVRKDLRDPRIKGYSPMMVVYGRKPKPQ